MQRQQPEGLDGGSRNGGREGAQGGFSCPPPKHVPEDEEISRETQMRAPGTAAGA